MVEVSLQNIGPIAGGTIALGPLTVIVGPNNSGKSVLAMATYAATHARNSLTGMTTFHGPGGKTIRVAMGFDRPARTVQATERLRTSCMKWALTALLGDDPVESDDIPPDVRGYLEAELTSGLEQFGHDFALELERCFGSKLATLFRSGTTGPESYIEVCSNNGGRWRVRLEITKRTFRVQVSESPDVIELLELVRRNHQSDLARLFTRERYGDAWTISQMVGYILDQCFRDFPSSAYYLPAARSGILQSHRALASFVMSRAPLAGIQDMQIPRMTGVLTDFIGQLLEMTPRRQGPFHETAAELETSLLQGAIAIRTSPNSYPEILYRVGTDRYPLHRTSSMISEIAPIVLYLRNILEPEQFLIIEEPESHLHPRSQVLLAESLTRVVKRGLSVMITTHSDYFLSAINNAIVAGTVAADPHADGAFSGSAQLLASEVKAYLLEIGEDGTTVRSLDVSPREGIPEEEFASVAESLYAETVAMDEHLIRNGS